MSIESKCFFKLILFDIWLAMGITKPCTYLHPAPSTSIQLILASTHVSQRYWNQNAARNWATFLNLGRKIQSCLFWLKISTHDTLEVIIPNPDLEFWNHDPKIHFWARLGQKRQSCLFCLEIGTHGISRMLLLIPTLFFWFSKPKSILGQISKLFVLPKNWHARTHTQTLRERERERQRQTEREKEYLEDVDSYFDISFLKFQT